MKTTWLKVISGRHNIKIKCYFLVIVLNESEKRQLTMNSEIWAIKENICRCCHAEGSFQNLAEPRPYCGELEVYTDMIKEMFDIEIRPIPGPLCELTYAICMACVTKLRDAIQFKKQVQSCEDRFIDLYFKNKLEVFRSNSGIKKFVKEESDNGDSEPELSGIDFKTESLESEEDMNNGDMDQDYDVDNVDFKSEDEIITANVKKKRKGKRVKKEIVEELEPVRMKKIKKEQKKKDADKKDEKTPTFSLQPEDYSKDGDIYKCSRCEKEYNKKVSLRFHVKTKHYKIPRFICQHCKEEFMTLAPFTVHKLQEHNIDDRFKCNACPNMFNSHLQLSKHTKNYHMLGDIYKCEFCEYETYSFESMYKHKYKHKTVKDFHCKFCRKSFLRKTTLDLHERIHTNDRRKICKECGQAFVQKSSLNYHMTRHHPEVIF